MGFLMIINEIRYFYLGFHSLLEGSQNKEVKTLFQKSDKVLKKNKVDLTIGVIIVITSCYGLFLDIEEMHARTVGVVIGSLMSLLALRDIFLGFKKVGQSVKKINKA